MPLVLDIRTLMVTTALVIAVSGLLLLLTARRPSQKPEVPVLFGVALLVGALGYVMTALERATPLQDLDGLGTTFFIAAVSISWSGARAFADRPKRPWVAAAGPIAWLASLPLQQAFPDQAAIPAVVAACTIGVAYTLGILVNLATWTTPDEYLPSRRPALLLQSVHALLYAGRALLAASSGSAMLQDGRTVGLLVLESLMHSMGMAFLLLALLKEKAELRSIKQLRALTLQDSLTGIPNRRHFEEQLANEAGRASRTGAPLALLMIDVDHFKAFNDSLGHQRGDQCLRLVAQALSHPVHRAGDLVARYGGEEFVALLPNTELPEALRFAERVRAEVQRLRLHHPDPASTGFITVSIGAAAATPSRSGTAASLVRSADLALYSAKTGGRNRVAAATPARQDDLLAP